MDTQKRFDLVIQALTELEPELRALPRREVLPAAPALDDVLAGLGPLPREALFLGMAEDGLPVLLDLEDAAPGPLLLTGDPGSGKTAFLQLVAAAASRLHPAEGVQFGVVTANPGEWDEFAGLPNSAGIYPVYDNAAMDFVLGLTAWAHNNRHSRQAVLLLIDELSDSVTKMDFDALQNLRWLLLRGPSRRVWPVATLDSFRFDDESLPWLEAFRTRLFGRITDPALAGELVPDFAAEVAAFIPRIQFALREGRRLLRFWLPSLNG
ncbi:MAG: hypothetical protein AB1846_18595 [Chloroflexota bacterium]